jgi:hypothetical protein
MNAVSPPPPVLKLVPPGPRLDLPPESNLRPAIIDLATVRRIKLLGKIS